MVFSSMIFIAAFLGASILLVRLPGLLGATTPKARNLILLALSLVFYAFSGIRFLLLLMAVVLIVWFLALQMEKTEGRRGLLLILTVALLLLNLGFFKYSGWLSSLMSLPLPAVSLPLGISFYTFSLIGYAVDVKRGTIPAEKSYLKLLLFTVIFHRCTTGPIARYGEFANDAAYPGGSPLELNTGIGRFSIGLAKKAILASALSPLSELVVGLSAAKAGSLPWLAVFLSGLGYFFQLYFDFSGYSDMAIGLGLMCGFHYPENFRFPYLSGSVAEFWRRWHISLGAFFRDYVYIPLGGNRCSIPRQVLNILVVWLLTGLWHGAGWNFILWGLYFGILLILERFVIAKIPRTLPVRILLHVVAPLLVFVSWFFFRIEDLPSCFALLRVLFTAPAGFATRSEVLLLRNNLFLLLFCFVASTSFLPGLLIALRRQARGNAIATGLIQLWEALFPALLLLLSAIALVGSSYSPFLYAQF